MARDKNIKSIRAFSISQWGQTTEEVKNYDIDGTTKEAVIMGIGIIERKDSTQEYIEQEIFTDVIAGVIQKKLLINVDVYNEPLITITDKNGHLIYHNPEIKEHEAKVKAALHTIAHDRLIKAYTEITYNIEGKPLGDQARYIRDIVKAETRYYYSFAFIRAVLSSIIDELTNAKNLEQFSNMQLRQFVSDMYCITVNPDSQLTKLQKEEITGLKSNVIDEIVRRFFRGTIK